MAYNVVIWRDETAYVAKNLELGIVSQGETIEEATDNIKEATELFLEDEKEMSTSHNKQTFRPAVLTRIVA